MHIVWMSWFGCGSGGLDRYWPRVPLILNFVKHWIMRLVITCSFWVLSLRPLLESARWRPRCISLMEYRDRDIATWQRVTPSALSARGLGKDTLSTGGLREVAL
ncbi:hypothetical protein XENTR_v10017638 [Xenopus tropicalis]|nr:hypothetical protein XENTR_v10017638 [Xenopus tropicalis]